MPTINSKIEFHKFPINERYGPQVYEIYAVIDNGRSEVISSFKSLTEDEKDRIKDLISKMATKRNFKSPKINYNLKAYNYGEIKPRPHRFFFFQKCGNNYIFFSYIIKKKNSLGNKIYSDLEKKKDIYAREFEKFIKRGR